MSRALLDAQNMISNTGALRGLVGGPESGNDLLFTLNCTLNIHCVLSFC